MSWNKGILSVCVLQDVKKGLTKKIYFNLATLSLMLIKVMVHDWGNIVKWEGGVGKSAWYVCNV